MSQTQTGSSLVARRLRIRMRVGSARALNQAAKVSASGSLTVGVPGGAQQGCSRIVRVGRSRVLDTRITPSYGQSIDHTLISVNTSIGRRQCTSDVLGLASLASSVQADPPIPSVPPRRSAKNTGSGS